MNISLVILTKNEIEGVKAIIPQINKNCVDEIIAVDGKSNDGTKEYLESQGITVYTQDKLGRGEAFRLAMEKTTGDALIFYSPDGNEDPKDISKFKPFFEQGADVVIASRMMKGAYNEEDESLWRPRKWVNQAFGLAANIIWNRGPFITDTINGFRAIRKDVFRDLAPDGSGYTIEYQSSIRSFKKKKKIIEFPTHESSRIGVGGSPSMSTGIAFIKCFLREIGISLHIVS